MLPASFDFETLGELSEIADGGSPFGQEMEMVWHQTVGVNGKRTQRGLIAIAPGSTPRDPQPRMFVLDGRSRSSRSGASGRGSGNARVLVNL